MYIQNLCQLFLLYLRQLNYYHLQKKADLIWDADEYYLNNENQEAGLFLRTNLELFKQKDFSFIGTHFKTEKEITIVSAPKQIGQAQVVRQTLQKLIGTLYKTISFLKIFLKNTTTKIRKKNSKMKTN